MGKQDSKTINMVVKKGFHGDLGRRNVDMGVAFFNSKTNIFGLCLFLLFFAFWNSSTS